MSMPEKKHSKSRERFQSSLAHKKADRLPIDIGGTGLTAMSKACQDNLLAYLGLDKKNFEPSGSGVDERILKWAGTDFRQVGGIVSLPSSHAKRLSETATIDSWGVRWEHIGEYSEITNSPLKNSTIDDLKTYKWPEPRINDKLLRSWVDQAQVLKQKNEQVVIASHPVFGILELGCWLCGYDDFLLKMALDPDFVRAFFDQVLAIQLAVSSEYYAALGPYIDLTTSGDDFGAQTGPLISPAMFREIIAPYFTERIQLTKRTAGCLYWHHSCGSVFDLVDELIACGVDILNPVQTSVAKMDPENLKAKFGERIMFWGGVDVQQFLPRARPEEVTEHIRQLKKTLGQNGGYVFAPAHNMQSDIPPENIAAFVKAARSGEEAGS